QWQHAPDIGHDHRGQAQPFTAQVISMPIRPEQATGTEYVQLHQNPVDRTEGRIQQPQPDNGRQRYGHGPRQNEQYLEQPFAAKRMDQQFTGQRGQYQYQHKYACGNNQAVAQRELERIGLYDSGKVRQADEIVQARIADGGIAQAQRDGQYERKTDKGD